MSVAPKGKFDQEIAVSPTAATERPRTFGEWCAPESERLVRCPSCDEEHPVRWWSVEMYNYLRCGFCGLVYLDQMPSVSELESYYNTAFQVDRERQESKIVRQYRPMLRVLEEMLPNKGRLLEIGCSYGHFLSKVKLMVGKWRE